MSTPRNELAGKCVGPDVLEAVTHAAVGSHKTRTWFFGPAAYTTTSMMGEFYQRDMEEALKKREHRWIDDLLFSLPDKELRRYHISARPQECRDPRVARSKPRDCRSRR